MGVASPCTQPAAKNLSQLPLTSLIKAVGGRNTFQTLSPIAGGGDSWNSLSYSWLQNDRCSSSQLGDLGLVLTSPGLTQLARRNEQQCCNFCFYLLPSIHTPPPLATQTQNSFEELPSCPSADIISVGSNPPSDPEEGSDWCKLISISHS